MECLGQVCGGAVVDAEAKTRQLGEISYPSVESRVLCRRCWLCGTSKNSVAMSFFLSMSGGGGNSPGRHDPKGGAMVRVDACTGLDAALS